VDDPRPLVLEAWSAPDTLRLTATWAEFQGSRTLALTPVIGWALIQTVFDLGGAFELLAHICWLAALMMPVGWWGMQASTRRWRVLGVAAVWLWAGAAAMPRVFGVAPVSARDWALMAACLGAGAALGHVAGRRARRGYAADDT
jgi:hypothetical protein